MKRAVYNGLKRWPRFLRATDLKGRVLFEGAITTRRIGKNVRCCGWRLRAMQGAKSLQTNPLFPIHNPLVLRVVIILLSFLGILANTSGLTDFYFL